MSKCPKCGNTTSDDFLFCPLCGEKLVASVSQPIIESNAIDMNDALPSSPPPSSVTTPASKPRRRGFWNFIRKVPTALMMWFTLFLSFTSILDLINFPTEGLFLWFVWLNLIFPLPVVLSVLCIYAKRGKTRFYQRWWFWLIGVHVALCLMFLAIDVASVDTQTYDPSTTVSDSNEAHQSTQEETEPTASTKPKQTEPTTAPTKPKQTEPTTAPTKPKQTEPTTAPTKPKQTEPTTAPTKPKETKPSTPTNPFVKDFCAKSGFKESTAKAIYDMLHDDMHFETIKFSGKNSVGNINWDITADGYKIMLTADDDGIYHVICGNFVLFKDSKVVLTKEDIEARNVSQNASFYYVIAKEIVSSGLKAPSSAKFTPMYECGMQRNGNLVAVQGYVEAQNALGVRIKNKFTVQFTVIDEASFSYKTNYMQIGNEVSGKFIDMD